MELIEGAEEAGSPDGAMPMFAFHVGARVAASPDVVKGGVADACEERAPFAGNRGHRFALHFALGFGLFGLLTLAFTFAFGGIDGFTLGIPHETSLDEGLVVVRLPSQKSSVVLDGEFRCRACSSWL